MSLKHGARKFYDIDIPANDHDVINQQILGQENAINYDDVKNDSILQYIARNVIGKDKNLFGPFGFRKVIYCDYTASGRSLSLIEEYITEEVLPDYGNTHTTSTVTSLQTTLYRHEARDIVRNAVNASEHDAVIFTGSGTTAAVHKLINALQLKAPPVVFVSPFEHHSNLLPWRDVGATVVRCRETSNGQMDVPFFEKQLQAYKSSGRQLLGCFSAASNITGTLVPVDKVTSLIHAHGGLAFWDYATAAPYVNVDMNPVAKHGDQNPAALHKDAVFISTHKFVGGVQTPGILIVKKKLLKNPIPSGSGGGSVFFVRRDSHRYLQEAEMREEGGTPAIVESIRAGMVFQLKQSVGHQVIMNREEHLTSMAFTSWAGVQDLVILGSSTAPRLAIFSFMIRHAQSKLFLHYNYVAALLNDLFGIQTRGGCACAGPYAQDLLGIDETLAEEIELILAEDDRLDRVHLRRYREYSSREILRPGFVRLNLPYFMDDDTVKFILEAVKHVALHGWRLLPMYTFNPETGEWRHRNHQVFKDRKWLGHISYKSGTMKYDNPVVNARAEDTPKDYQDCIKMADKLLHDQKKLHIGDQRALFDDSCAHLRWFLLPSEAYQYLTNKTYKNTQKVPFNPPTYPLHLPHTDFPMDVVPCGTPSHIDDAPPGEFIEGMQAAVRDGFVNDLEAESSTPTAGEQLQAVVDEKQSSDCEKTEFKQSPSVDNAVEPADGHVEPPTTTTKPEPQTEATTSTATHSESNTNVPTASPSTCPTESEASPEESAVCDGLQTSKVCGDVGACADDVGACVDDVCCPLVKPRQPTSDAAEPVPPTVKYDWYNPPKNIMNPTRQAIDDYNMIRDGDRILVCLSGGKDSLSLLHTLKQYQYFSTRRKNKVHFEIGAVTIDPGTEAYDPSPLKPYLAGLGVPYFYEEQEILNLAMALEKCRSICSFCSRMKRGRIYTAARREGYNVLAMGQHLDDLAESFLMSVFHNGTLRTMKASYCVDKGDLRLIRPFAYVREKDLRQFAEESHLPVIPENCPACFEAPKERHRMKQLLASQEVMFPRLFYSLQGALKPLMSISECGMNVKSIFEEYRRNAAIREAAATEAAAAETAATENVATENATDEEKAAKNVSGC